MQEPRYHPLVDYDTDGTEKLPMFMAKNESMVIRSHRFYLEETVPKVYRLKSVNGTSEKTAKDYIIHCPLCGKAMQTISAPRDNHNLGLYACPNCK